MALVIQTAIIVVLKRIKTFLTQTLWTFLDSKAKKLVVSETKQGGPGEEYSADPASLEKKGKRSSEGVGASRVARKRAAPANNSTSLDSVLINHPPTNELSLIKKITKRKSEINRQCRKREKTATLNHIKRRHSELLHHIQ